MNRAVTIVLTLVALVIGAFIVFANPVDPLAITIGMLIISVTILNLAVQIYFPPSQEQTVELNVVEEPEKIPVKVEKNIEKPQKVVKSRKRR